jgi:hypothetical protein
MAGGEHLDYAIGGRPGHSLGPFRTRIDMAMMTSLVAQFSDIYLERARQATTHWRKTMALQRAIEFRRRLKDVSHRGNHTE